MRWVFDGQAVLMLRNSKGMTIGAFGEKIGVTGQQVAQWEQGEVTPTAKMVAKIATAFDVIPGYFFKAETEEDKGDKEE